MVMLLHFTTQLRVPTTAAGRLMVDSFSFGWAGVDLFFVLSGFLITRILFDAREAASYYRPFYARRVLRIMPLYYGSLIVLFIVAPLVAGGPDASWRELAWYWAYLGNFKFDPTPTREWVGHFWSLAIEEQFYLAWPLVIRLCSRRAALGVCALAIIGSLAYRVAALHFNILSGNVYHVTPARLDGLAVGAAIALLWRDPTGRTLLRRWSPAIGAAAAAVLAIIVVRRGWPIPLGYETVTVGYSATVLLFGAVLVSVALAHPASRLARVLERPQLMFWGRYSYALYVVHVPLIAAMKRAGFHPAAALGLQSELARLLLYTGVMTAASLAIALLAWHGIEKHFLKLKRFFEYSDDVVGARSLPRVPSAQAAPSA
jgi:peptidoglycan/LPS O-acetylase OafA/YrhL